jgi:type III pantothenate kinase
MNITIDIGNTRSKYAFFVGSVPLGRGYNLHGWVAKAMECRARGEEVNVILASSGEVPPATRACVRELSTFFVEASTAMPLPIRLDYETPDTLGIDRVAACVAAVTLFPGRPLLVVDAGTAITFNFVDAAGTFLGGNISPGVATRYRALHDFTARLPLVQEYGRGDTNGKNTRDAISQGVTRGVLLELNGYANDFLRDNPDGALLLTGGDVRWLSHLLPGEWRFAENLVMAGLDEILRYQMPQEEYDYGD